MDIGYSPGVWMGKDMSVLVDDPGVIDREGVRALEYAREMVPEYFTEPVYLLAVLNRSKEGRARKLFDFPLLSDLQGEVKAQASIAVISDPLADLRSGSSSPEMESEVVDTDGDGLSDDQETMLGTLPDRADSDGDGYSDPDANWTWENQADACPFTNGSSREILCGCPDMDRDWYPDIVDPDIDGDGEPDRLIPSGILWMQGESDGTLYSASLEYEANLKRLMDLIRASLHQDDLPVVVGRISDSMKDGKKVWEFGETLRAAQAAFCDKDPAASLVTSTDNYGYSDPWHYDTAGYLDLGEKFAEAMNDLLKK